VDRYGSEFVMPVGFTEPGARHVGAEARDEVESFGVGHSERDQYRPGRGIGRVSESMIGRCVNRLYEALRR